MMTISKAQKIMNILLKDLSSHTATSLSKDLKMSRWGLWKILKKLEKDKLIEMTNNKNSYGSGICLTKTTRKGAIDYSSIPEIKEIDLEKYRKPSCEFWTVREK